MQSGNFCKVKSYAKCEIANIICLHFVLCTLHSFDICIVLHFALFGMDEHGVKLMNIDISG